MKRKPKFRVGQVVSLNSFYGNFSPGQVGPGFKGRRGWRYSWEFGKVVKIIVPDSSPRLKKDGPFCYFLDGWMSALPENWLRALTKRERTEGDND